MTKELQEMSADPALRFRRLMGRFPTGVAVIGVLTAEGPRGMTVNSLTSVSLDPLLLLFCVARASRTGQEVLRSKRFSVSVLASDQQEVSSYFASSGRHGRRPDWTFLADVPAIDECRAIFACEVSSSYEQGDHLVVFGRVLDMSDGGDAAMPLVYHAGEYCGLAASHSHH